MSSHKRQKIEEFQDPDYRQDNIPVKASGSDSDRQAKIKMIIKRQFLNEINSKEEEIQLIDHKLNQAKRLLQRVRYAVALSYYTKTNLVHSANELKHENSATASSAGQAIHPSLKKLLGKKPIDYEEILKSRSPRNAAKTARNTLIKPKKRETANPDKDVAVNEVKIPRYVSPKKSNIQIEKINSSRGRNQTSHLIVVGNTSKYIGDEKSANEVTHKWLVYIKTKTSVGIEDMVSKVRFFLHPSYKPNDVIEVDSPPFQISRRGWGEFPIRVQLYFHESINQKPLQIYHNLVLDKKMTGLQTMGAETVVEIWLDFAGRSNCLKESKSKCLPMTSEQERTVKLEEVEKKSVIEQQAMNMPPIKIKMEEPLIINESKEIESRTELTENDGKKPDTSMKSSHSILNDISDIFKDAVTTKNDPPKKIEVVKLKPAPFQQKKNLVRCLDSNGKIVFVQLQVDPNNPKNIKIIKAPAITSTQATSLSVAKPPVKLVASTEQKRHITPATNVLSNTANTLNHMSTTTSTSAAVTQKPMMVKNNANLLENKKIFIIKTPGASNSTLTNPPPLVRISNPHNVALAPRTANVKVIEASRKVTINSKNLLMKNGKIIILDKEKLNAKPKQESLLKPQVSLLKPLYQKQSGEPIPTKSILIQKPSINSVGSRYRKPTLMTQNTAKRDYRKEFETIFHRHRFQTVRSAVEYLLRNTPLVNPLSSRPDFNAVFPFVAESHEKFDNFPFPKRRLNEWYRAKCVLRMIEQHPDLKNQEAWMVREIIIFGRRFGYTDVNVVKNSTTNHLQNTENPFKDIIKQHIKEEQLKNFTITYNKKINDFIKNYDVLTSTMISADPLEIVDVDGFNETPTIDIKPNATHVAGEKLLLDVNKIMQGGGTLINDICRDIQIKLHKEEIVGGVLCSSSQLILWQAMRSFIEDLIRRSFATKPPAEQISDLSAERCVRVDNVRKAISTTENFSFLANKHLGKRTI